MMETNEEIRTQLLQTGDTLRQPVSVIKENQKLKKTKGYAKHILVIRDKTITYQCTICCKSFKSKSNCSYHRHCADEVDKRFQCTICDRKFASKAHFSYHSLTHTGANPFQCTICEKAFKTKSKLSRHQLVHADKEKKFSCDICDKLFLRKSSIKIHKRFHTGEKPYQCNECAKAFRAKRNLIFHLSSHTGLRNWICEFCGKSYSIKWELELHKRRHTGYMPYQCSFNKCGKLFTQNRYLKRHMEKHKNSVKFVCSLCSKVFSRKDNLQRHILNSHLDSQLATDSQSEKTKNLQNTSAYIQAIKMTNEDEVNEPISVIRTESVIKSVFSVKEVIESQASKVVENRVSVIQKASSTNSGMSGIHEQRAVAVFDTIHENNYLPVDKNFASEYEYGLNPSATVDYYSLTPVPVDNLLLDENNHSIPHYKNRGDEVFEEFERPRCFIPKKIIAASYRNKDFENEHVSSRFQDCYKLLDLSMRSQE